MTEPTLLFAAVANADGQPSGTVQYQINQDALRSPEEAGELVHALHFHLAQALVDKGTSPDVTEAYKGISEGITTALNRLFADIGTPQTNPMES